MFAKNRSIEEEKNIDNAFPCRACLIYQSIFLFQSPAKAYLELENPYLMKNIFFDIVTVNIPDEFFF